MGLFDIFSKEKREERSRAGNIQRALNKYAQTGDRYRAMEALATEGSEESTYGLLRRFGMMYDKSIEDEQEKEWVFDTLVSKGESALPAVKRYLSSAESVSWPLRVLQKIAPTKDAEIDLVAEILSRHEPGYERDPTKKIQLIRHLGLMKHAKSPALVVPYLEDMDEGVRFATIEALLACKAEEAARDKLLELFVSDKEESLRLRIRIAEGFADLGWLVQGHRGGVEKKLPEGFKLDREGHIVKLKKPE
jgi:HEAT repeats